jgi:hypothetical protein
VSDKCEVCGTYGCVDDKVCGLRVEANQQRARAEAAEATSQALLADSNVTAMQRDAYLRNWTEEKDRADRLEEALQKALKWVECLPRDAPLYTEARSDIDQARATLAEKGAPERPTSCSSLCVGICWEVTHYPLEAHQRTPECLGWECRNPSHGEEKPC